MLKKIKTLIAVAALSGTVSANVQAATVTPQQGDTPWDQIHNLTITQEQPNQVSLGDNLWNHFINSNIALLPMTKWNQSITTLIHPGLNLSSFDVKPIVVKEEPATPVTGRLLATIQTKPAPAPANVVVATAVPKPVKTEVATKPSPAPAKAVAAPAPVTKAPATTQPSPAPASPDTSAAPPTTTEPSQAQADSSSKEITVKATAYTASCEGCSGVTATGVNIKDNPDKKVIAVDPNVIPLGSKVYVEGIGEATAADTGGAIKGNRIDVFIPTVQAAKNFGVKHLKVTILE
jgi:3D (Asp-Asp-Asp) domain-containing protein